MKSTMFNGYKLNLIESSQELTELRGMVVSYKTFGCDTETEGLDFLRHSMVGFCLAFGKPLQGYYLPIRHVIGRNLPIDQVVELIQFVISNKKSMWFNRNFDFSMVEKEGVEIPLNADYHDAQPMCWMASNEGFPALKKFAKNYLKVDVIEFGEAAGTDESGQANHNFGETDPEQSYIYAAFDPVITLRLGVHMWNNYPYIRKIYPIDNKVTECCRRMGQVDVYIDYPLVKSLLEFEERGLRDLKQQAISMAGYEFNVGSNKEKGEALSRFVTLTQRTKSGLFSVKDEVLQDIEHPLAKVLLSYSKKVKYISSYLKALLIYEGKTIHFNFKTCDVPCLTKESTVLIKGKGIVSVADVRREDLIWTRYGYKKVVFAEPYTHDVRLVRVKTKNGITYTSTPWHPVRILTTTNNHGWLDSDKLSKGDLIIRQGFKREGDDYPFDKSISNVDLFYSLGLFCNTLFRKVGAGDFTIAIENIDLIKPFLEKLYDKYGYEVKLVKSNETIVVFNVPKALLLRLNVALDYLLYASPHLWSSFIAGLLDYSYLKEPIRKIYSISLQIPAKLYEVFTMIMNYSGVSTVSVDWYGVDIDGNYNLSNFITIVRGLSVTSSLIERSLDIDSSLFDKLHNVDMVTSVEEVEPEVVYHIEVEDVHEYIADGLVHHNTGRMACGSMRGNDYYARLNIQSIPKVSKKRFIHPDPELGYCLNDVEEGSLGKQKVKAGLRDAFIAPEGYYFLTADYNSEELCITANLSSETTFIEPLQRGEDLHMATSKQVFGIEDDAMRDKVKTISFGTLYGMDKFSLAKRLKVSVDMAGDMIATYYNRLPHLSRWKKYVIDTARKKGMVFTFFGRPRLLYKFYASSDYKDRAFADRSAVNSIVQGCIPLNLMVELKNSVTLLENTLLKKVVIADGREAIGSSRGTGIATLVMCNTGDFIITDREHALLYGSLKEPKYRRVNEGLDEPLLTSPLRKKTLSLKTLFKLVFSKGSLKTKLKDKMRSLAISKSCNRTSETGTYFRLFKWFGLEVEIKDYYHAANLRSIASLHGYNLIADCTKVGNVTYRLKSRRKQKIRAIWAREIGQCTIGSMTLQSGYQYYQSQGFQNKNTGGDVMRILLCRLYQQMEMDPEFKENFIVAWHVHDEINCYIKKEYLFKAYYKVVELMTIRPTNWQVALTSEIGIGRNWGDCLDACGITREGKLIVPGINDAEELPKLNLDVRGLPHDTIEERDAANAKIKLENNTTDSYQFSQLNTPA